jgi:hypothetical protein
MRQEAPRRLRRAGHEDIGVENGVCSSDDRKSGLRSTGSYANHIRCHAAGGFALSDFVTTETRRRRRGGLLQGAAGSLGRSTSQISKVCRSVGGGWE